MTRRRGSFRARSSFIGHLSLVVPDCIQPACQRSALEPETEKIRPLDAGRLDAGLACTGVLRPGNMWRCFLATLFGLFSVAAAQPEPDSLAPPNPSEAMRAYRLVHDWVRSLDVPDTTPTGQPMIPGACVVLRSAGGIVGRGAVFADDNSALRAAAKGAIEEARARLRLPNDALAAELALAAAAEWSISLELAGPLIPIKPVTFSDCDLELQHGLDGVAARVGGIGGTLSANFPGLMLALGMPPSDALAAAISTAAGKPNIALKMDPKGQPGHIAEEHRAMYYRFRTTHLAQTVPGAEPVFLFRGGRVVDVREITIPMLRRFAFDLAERLAGRRGADGAATNPLTEPYYSWRGRSVTSADEVLDEMLRHFALLHFTALRGEPAEPERAAELRAAAAADAAAYVEQVFASTMDEGAKPLSSVHAAAMAVLAGADMAAAESGVVWKALRAHAAWNEALEGSFDAEAGWRSKISEAQRAFIVYGLACMVSEPGLTPEERERRQARAESALRTVYRATKDGLLVSHMPWLGWAELRLASGKSAVPAAAALRDMRDLVWKHQLTMEDVGTDGPDLAGGIVFTTGANPLPTWQSARPIAFLARIMGDARLTDKPEQLREVSRMTSALRFLRQLAVDDAAAYAAADPRTAMWGVRASVWDQRQTPEATALTLIAVCDALRSMDRIAADQLKSEPSPSPE